MAKPTTILIKLVSTADTGFYYVTKKNPRNITEKMEFRKYDPVVRKHVMFKEASDEELADADVISTVEFDLSGDYIATGDRGGRVVIFQQVPASKVCFCFFISFPYS